MKEDVAENNGLLLFNCPGCGSQLYFDAAKQQLQCSHCGTQVAIEKGTNLVKEKSLRDQITTGNDTAATVEQLVYKCERCGSETMTTTETPTFVCSFCNYEAVNPQAYKTRVVQPSGIIPFVIEKKAATDLYKAWIGKGFWAPGDLKQFAKADALHGMYLPFWTYDAQTDSEWSGYGGRYYYVTETYTDSQGKEQTRQVQQTEWIYRSGRYEHFFDDILIGGSKELPQDEYETVFPFNLNELVNFDAKYLAGWQADVYDVAVNDGYSSAEKMMDNYIESECAALCTIDTYKSLSVSTEYSQQTYKHILLPLWLCTYLYKNKTYHFLINGQTGKISGKKPVSSGKIVLAVILAIVIGLIIYWLSQQSE